MKIKKFQAASFREALSRVKKELGQEAVILSSEEIKGSRSKVEVVAAIEQDLEREELFNDSLLKTGSGTEKEGEVRSDKVSLSAGRPVFKKEPAPVYHEQVLQELHQLRKSLEALKDKGYEVSLPKEKRRMFHYLKDRFIREDLSLQLTEKAADLNDLAGLIQNDLEMGWDWSERKVIVLIGSTGAGKTTTAAKLCGQALKQNTKVGLISLDTFRIGAVEQIRIYSRILGVPLIIASSPEEVENGLKKLEDRDLILIDTTGRNHKDRTGLNELQKIYALGIPMETHLLISGSSSEPFMNESFSHYRNLPVNWIAFTKMDEAVGEGSVHNLSVLARKPMAYLTCGQKVPNDIEFCNPVQLTDLILDHQKLNQFREIN